MLTIARLPAILVVHALIALLFTASSSSAQSATPRQATVAIYAFDTSPGNGGRNGSVGTGFFVDRKGLIVTAYHVIRGARRLEIFDYDKAKYVESDVTLARVDADRDLAFLQLRTPRPTTPLSLRVSLPRNNDALQIIGHPQGMLRLTLPARVTHDEPFESTQLIALDNRAILRNGVPAFNVLVVATTIYGGMSGGPILNPSGEALGLLSGSLGTGGSLGWGIPSTYIKAVMDRPANPRPWNDPSPWPPLPYADVFARSLSTTIAAVDVRPGAPQTRFLPVDLADVANTSLDWLVTPPSGDVSFDSIPFRILTGDRAVIHTRNYDRPDLPVAMRLSVNAASVSSIHLLVNGNWVDTSKQAVGTLHISYADGLSFEVLLVGMRTMRETWAYKNALFNASFVPPPFGVTWNNVFSEAQMRGGKPAIGFLDRLSVAVDPKRRVDTITVANTNWKSGTGIIVTAVTLEISAQKQDRKSTFR